MGEPPEMNIAGLDSIDVHTHVHRSVAAPAGAPAGASLDAMATPPREGGSWVETSWLRGLAEVGAATGEPLLQDGYVDRAAGGAGAQRHVGGGAGGLSHGETRPGDPGRRLGGVRHR